MTSQTTRRRTSNTPTQTPAQSGTIKGFYVKAKTFEVNGNSKLVAFVTFTFNLNGKDLFVLKDAKIMEGSHGLFLSMPSKKTSEGDYQDIAFPLTKEFRECLQNVALEAYDKGGNAESIFSDDISF